MCKMITLALLTSDFSCNRFPIFCTKFQIDFCTIGRELKEVHFGINISGL